MSFFEKENSEKQTLKIKKPDDCICSSCLNVLCKEWVDDGSKFIQDLNERDMWGWFCIEFHQDPVQQAYQWKELQRLEKQAQEKKTALLPKLKTRAGENAAQQQAA